ncbi:immunity 50 family protein [Streptomyces phaeoluteigriseus]|uniref:Immunity 50 family protein n=1 Tax=Streptomyces phaeoluteigriseus TaxID=114686 RepID=A0ABY4Z2N8_9ACTN|nr:Imm50 family immunity protein [Streptomyces phaeoluteigriseus]USQ83236.1 immunity 50 family protein [Streptomyces phaeoluteigriseus]
MNGSDWASILGESRFLGELYAGGSPAPEQCELFYVHLDERGDSATLGFETRVLPAAPRPEWREKPYNRFEFYVLLGGLTGFVADGWGSSEAASFDVSVVSDKEIAVRLGSGQGGMRFRASSIRVARTRVYLAAQAP